MGFDGFPHNCTCWKQIRLVTSSCVLPHSFISLHVSELYKLLTPWFCCDAGPEPKPKLHGDNRTFRVWLDPNQYQQDMTSSIQSGTEDPYETFNIIMRRKPKENNFKVRSPLWSHFISAVPPEILCLFQSKQPTVGTVFLKVVISFGII